MLFDDLEAGESSKNRLSVGFDFKVSAAVLLDISYLAESRKKASTWDVANIVKTTVKIRLK